MLAKKNYNVTTLSASASVAARRPDLQPTRANVRQWIRYLGDTPGLKRAAIFYAGHGSQLRALMGQEVDGLDECLVCQSARGPTVMPGAADMYRDDDLIRDIRGVFGHLDIDLFLMFDACHSGTVCDLGYELTRPRTDPDAAATASVEDGRGRWRYMPQGYVREPGELFRMVCISAAQDSEVALEAGSGGGMLTNKFMMAERRAGLALYAINKELSSMGFQHPQISAAQPTSQETVFWEKIKPDEVLVARSLTISTTTQQTGRRTWRGTDGVVPQRGDLWVLYRKLAMGKGVV
jgi:hypothetical protein